MISAFAGSEFDDQVLSAQQTRQAEARLVAEGSNPSELMRRAATGAAEMIWRIAAGQAVTVLAGSGNNGGDGYAAAEILRQRGAKVAVQIGDEPRSYLCKEARAAYAGAVVAKGLGGVGIDCLFGIGLDRPLSKAHSQLLLRFRSEHKLIVAADLPSGMVADTGQILGDVASADVTLAFGAWKPAHWLMPACAHQGERRLIPIGLPAAASTWRVSTPPRLEAPAPDAHKYTRGLVVVVGGEMSGAGVLASEGAMRAGAGYVRLVPQAHVPMHLPDLVVTGNDIAAELGDDRTRAVLVGPGLGRSEAARKRLTAVMRVNHDLVLDADALMLLTPELLRSRVGETILTPHAGELDALCATFGISLADKVSRAMALARATHCTVLAKGPDNVLTDGEQVRFFPAMPSWLSTAGTGDVLAGVVAARMAVCQDAFGAAEEAVWLHGQAARLCGASPTARMIAQAISKAYATFL